MHHPPARGLRDDEPQSAGRVRDHRHGVSDRSRADERAARVRRSDRQHVRQHRDRRLSAREHVATRESRSSASGGSSRILLWGTAEVELRAIRRRFRAVEQHHAAEAQSRRPRACTLDRQRGMPQSRAWPGGPQHAVRRHRRHGGRSAAACGRRSATPPARCGWLRPRCRRPPSTRPASRPAPVMAARR